jgi:GIY-YIG catalytic domain
MLSWTVFDFNTHWEDFLPHWKHPTVQSLVDERMTRYTSQRRCVPDYVKGSPLWLYHDDRDHYWEDKIAQKTQKYIKETNVRGKYNASLMHRGLAVSSTMTNMNKKVLKNSHLYMGMEYYGVIYQGELNGQVYVGQHVGMDVEKRWRGHEKPSSGCIKFRNAIQKYGKDKVVWSIIAYCKVGGQDRLDAMERYFIKKRNSLSPNGYNLEKGGRGGVPSDETKQKLSEAGKKRFQDPEAREKQSEKIKSFLEANPGVVPIFMERMKNWRENNPEAVEESRKNLVEYWDNPEVRERQSEMQKARWENPEAREKQSETQKKRFQDNPETFKRGEDHYLFGKMGAEHPNSKKVHQYSLDGDIFIKEWDCATVVERQIGIHHSDITAVCKGRRKSSGGFVWRYAN